MTREILLPIEGPVIAAERATSEDERSMVVRTLSGTKSVDG
jgi:hypothetical protein